MSNFELDQVFSFESKVTAPQQSSVEADPFPSVGADQATMHRALQAAGEAAYHWAIENDQINWSTNAAEILSCRADLITSGKRFASFMDAENLTSRYDAVMHTQSTNGP